MARSAKLYNFAGITPQLDDSLVDANVAMVAEDVDLGRGDLMPIKWAGGLTIGTSVIGTIVELDKDYIKTLPYKTDVVFLTAAWADLGRVAWIKNRRVMYADRAEFIADFQYRLGVPRPTKPIVRAVNTWAVGCDDDAAEGCEIISSFCHTFVNIHGQESAPSPPLEALPYNKSGIKVTLPNQSVDPDYRITAIRVYRTLPNQTTGLENQLNSGGDWYLIGEYPISSLGKEVSTESIGNNIEVLPSVDWELPPIADHLAMFPDTDTLVTATGNLIQFSEPGNHHAFPRSRDLVISDRIVSLTYFSGLIIVLTEGHPYIIQSLKNESGGAPVYTISREDEAYPCVSKDSVSVGGSGVVWASTDGLFTINMTRYGMNIKSLTNTIFHLDDWRSCDPSSIRGALHNGTYFFTADKSIKNSITGHEAYTWALTYDKTVYDQPKNIFLTSMSARADLWYKSRTDRLYGVIGRGYFEWNPVNGTPQPYNYSTRLLVEPGLTNYSAAKIVHDEDGDLQFEIWREIGSKSKLLYSRDVAHNEPFRLPRALLSVDHFIRLKGTSRVRRVHLADSILSLTMADDSTTTHGNTRTTNG